MKADKISLISKIVLIVLMVYTVVTFVLFAFVGDPLVLEVPAEMRENMAGDLTYPMMTNALLLACYLLLGLAMLVLVALGIMSFVRRAIAEPKAAIVGLLPVTLVVVLGVILLVVANTKTDAVILVQYVLFVVCLIASILGLCGIKRGIGKK
jgi:hypothetical protein